MLLSHGEDELSVSINLHACMDCHEFFKVSSQLLGRRILLRQPQMTHTFTDGNCSCNDRWSWEARLTPAVRTAAVDSQIVMRTGKIVVGSEAHTSSVNKQKN